MTWSKCREN